MTGEEVVIGSDVLVANRILLDLKLNNPIHQQEGKPAIKSITCTDPISRVPILKRQARHIQPVRKDFLNFLNVLESLEIVASLFRRCCRLL